MVVCSVKSGTVIRHVVTHWRSVGDVGFTSNKFQQHQTCNILCLCVLACCQLRYDVCDFCFHISHNEG